MNTVFNNTKQFAQQLRIRTLQMLHRSGASHAGSCLSVADILAVLYANTLRVDPSKPNWINRDRFIMSKGHSAAIYYATLSACGFFPDQWLDRYCQDGAELAGHITFGVPGVELSAGSLGHGLSVGLGMALAAKRDQHAYSTYVLLSDGECNEGSVWEAALLAPQLALGNLIAIIDYNKIQSFGFTKDVADLDPFADKWRAFRWRVIEVDGHNHNELIGVLAELNISTQTKPTMIIANTVKGKGVSFMENTLQWHYKSLNQQQLQLALAELGVDT